MTLYYSLTLYFIYKAALEIHASKGPKERSDAFT